MDQYSKTQFEALTNPKASPCISVYLPTHRSGVEVNERQDMLRLKNLLQTVESELENSEFGPREIQGLLKPAYELLENDRFWRQQLEGLAIFLAPDFSKIVKLPHGVEERFVINDTFYIAPVIPLLADRRLFYLLLISRKDSRLYEADQYHMQEVPVNGLPNGMDDVIHYEEKGGKQLFRKGGNPNMGGGSYHGHGGGVADDKEYVHKYLKEVDQTLWAEILGRQQVPLVLAGVDYMLAAYRQISRYNYIWEDQITGNLDRETPEVLYERAKQVLDGYFTRETGKAIEQYKNHSTTQQTASVPEDVILGSFHGQIADLFVEQGEHIWGRYHPDTEQLHIHDEQQESDECLINQAIIKTLDHGGAVHVLPAEDMPAKSKVAAFLRF